MSNKHHKNPYPKRGDNYKIIGYWDGDPIFRPKTPQEKLLEAHIKPEVANLFIGLNEIRTL